MLDVSKASYRGRMSACWPKWDSIPPHIIEVIWQDVLVSIFFSFPFLIHFCRFSTVYRLQFNILLAFYRETQAAIDIQTDDMVLAREYWMKKMRKNYRDSISEIKKSGKRPRWMGESVWQAWLGYWETDEAKASILIFFELFDWSYISKNA